MDSNFLKIGELSSETGVGIDAIRFYETKGILIPKSRTEKGYRLYSSDSIRILNFVKKAKELGFTLSEVRELLEIKILENGKCSQALEKIKEKESNIEKKILELKNMKKALKKISERCLSNNEEACHFLELLGESKNGK